MDRLRSQRRARRRGREIRAGEKDGQTRSRHDADRGTEGHGDKADQQRYIYSWPEKEGAFRGVGILRLHYLGLAALENETIPGRVGGGPVP